MKISDFFINNTIDLNFEFIENLDIINSMKGVQQNSLYHQEGDVHTHTVYVLFKLYYILKDVDFNFISIYDKQKLLITALFHDIGKINTTYFDEKDQEYHCKNHGRVGANLFRQLFIEESDIKAKEEICFMIKHHMFFHNFNKNNERDVIKLHKIKNSLSGTLFLGLLQLHKADVMCSFKKENYNMKETVKEVNEKITKIFYLTIDSENVLKQYKETFFGKAIFNLDKPKRNVYIMFGLSGSGKTTFVKKHSNNKKHYHISRDMIRAQLNIGGARTENDKVIGSREEEEKVTKLFNDTLISYLQSNDDLPIYIDNTHLSTVYMENLIELITAYNVDYKIFAITSVPVETCMKRRGITEKDNYIQKQYDKMDVPEPWLCEVEYI